MSRRYLVSTVLVLVGLSHVSCVGSCDLYNPRARVTGQYYLWRTELGDYYLERGHTYDRSTAGIVDGAVRQIGWDDDTLVVQRDPAVGDGQPDWIVLDVKHDTLSEPLQDAEWARMRDGDPRLKRLAVYSVDRAWEILGTP
jgi:hypothetical protein